MDAEPYRHEKVVMYTDGAARGNPGESASGFGIYKGGRLLFNGIVYNGIRTNNYAEYVAIIKALEWCLKNEDCGDIKVELFSDSNIVVNQINGAYKTRSGNLKELNEKARSLKSRFASITLSNVPRENAGIKRVDAALNRFLDSRASSKHKV